MVVKLPEDNEKHPIGRTVVGNSPDYQQFKNVISNYMSKRHFTREAGIQTFYEPIECNDLWERQFNRWWGWHWLRKRKDSLNRFKINLCSKENVLGMKRAFKINSSMMVPKYIRDQFDTPETPNTDYILGNIRIPHKPIRNTVRTSKYKYREHEPWLIEKGTTSDSIVTSIQIQPRRRRRSLQENIRGLSRRIRNYKHRTISNEYLNLMNTFKIDRYPENLQESTNSEKMWKNGENYLKKDVVNNVRDKYKSNSREGYRNNSREEYGNNSREEYRNNSREEYRNNSREEYRNNSRNGYQNISQDEYRNSSEGESGNHLREEYKNNFREESENFGYNQPNDNNRRNITKILRSNSNNSEKISGSLNNLRRDTTSSSSQNIVKCNVTNTSDNVVNSSRAVLHKSLRFNSLDSFLNKKDVIKELSERIRNLENITYKKNKMSNLKCKINQIKKFHKYLNKNVRSISNKNKSMEMSTETKSMNMKTNIKPNIKPNIKLNLKSTNLKSMNKSMDLKSMNKSTDVTNLSSTSMNKPVDPNSSSTFLKPINVLDINYIPASKFPWLRKCLRIKKEHEELMRSLHKNRCKFDGIENVSETKTPVKDFFRDDDKKFRNEPSKSDESTEIDRFGDKTEKKHENKTLKNNYLFGSGIDGYKSEEVFKNYKSEDETDSSVRNIEVREYLRDKYRDLSKNQSNFRGESSKNLRNGENGKYYTNRIENERSNEIKRELTKKIQQMSNQIGREFSNKIRRELSNKIEREFLRNKMGVSRHEIGTSRNEIGTSRNEIGTSRNEIGTSRNEIGTSRNEMGTTRNFTGTSRNVIGTSRNQIGTSRNVIGTSRNVMGTSRNVMGTSRNVMGTSRNVMGTSRNVMGTSRNVMGTSRSGMDTSEGKNRILKDEIKILRDEIGKKLSNDGASKDIGIKLSDEIESKLLNEIVQELSNNIVKNKFRKEMEEEYLRSVNVNKIRDKIGKEFNRNTKGNGNVHNTFSNSYPRYDQSYDEENSGSDVGNRVDSDRGIINNESINDSLSNYSLGFDSTELQDFNPLTFEIKDLYPPPFVKTHPHFNLFAFQIKTRPQDFNLVVDEINISPRTDISSRTDEIPFSSQTEEVSPRSFDTRNYNPVSETNRSDPNTEYTNMGKKLLDVDLKFNEMFTNIHKDYEGDKSSKVGPISNEGSSSGRYDINYITNNIQSFSSQISDLKFLYINQYDGVT